MDKYLTNSFGLVETKKNLHELQKYCPAVTTAAFVKGPHYVHLTRNSGNMLKTHVMGSGDGEACAARDKSGSCDILRDCCEIQKTHLLGIEFLMTSNENGAVKVFLFCVSPIFCNPTETLRRRGREVKAGLMEINRTVPEEKKRRKKKEIIFHCVLLKIMAAWRGPGVSNMLLVHTQERSFRTLDAFLQ